MGPSVGLSSLYGFTYGSKLHLWVHVWVPAPLMVNLWV